MRVAVTGGAGFLGSHVADVLVQAGHEVRVVDLIDSERHASVKADLADVQRLAAAFRGVDAICHLAAIGDVYLASQRPALAAHVNVTGTANVCDAAIAAGVSDLVYASTWEVYGKPLYEPMDELHPCTPDHPYNITKLAGERLAIAYGHATGSLRVIALRLGTAYGTRMRPNSVFSVFIRRAIARESIEIQGSGAQGRQFTHAIDVGRAFVAALTSESKGQAYNIVADRMVSIRELAELVRSSKPTEITYGEPRPGDVPSAHVTSAKAAAELGWRPKIEFEQGLRELFEEADALPKAAAG